MDFKEAAKGYIPAKMKNISELSSVDTTLTLLDGDGVGDDGKAYKYKYVELNGERYRVPNVVIGQLKDIMEVKPDLKHFRVKKAGEGKTGTKYTVIQLD